jgi:uncharacterized membrane protein YGL010W
MDSLFTRQFATYAGYHRGSRNRATHFIGIPAVVFSILVAFALLRVGGVSTAVVVACLALIGWIALDLVIGLAMAVMIILKTVIDNAPHAAH